MFKKIVLFLFFVLFLCNPAYAVPPVTTIQSFSEGYVIKAPIQEFHQQYKDYKFNFHVFNISNGNPIINSSTIACYFHLYNSSGNHLIDMRPDTFDHTFDFEVGIKGGNFSLIDEYHYIFQCNSTFGRGGFIEDYFYVTKDGIMPSVVEGYFYMALLIVLIVFIILCIIGIINSGSLWLKYCFMSILYLLFIALTFICWQMADSYITSSYLISFFKWTFLILMFGFIPYIFLSLAYVIYYHVIILKRVTDLHSKGYTMDEIERRVNIGKK